MPSIDYSDINLAASFRDAPPFVQQAIMGAFPIERWGEAAAIAFLESGNNPDAHNINAGENSQGLFQINVIAHPKYSMINLFHPGVNALAAREVFDAAGGWSPWHNAARQLGLI